jgi:catechol 2,3-dioxygenase-like lactoylglutathione lyase family enzyme
MRLDRAMLFVVDLERMEAFYRKVVGLEPIEATRHDDWVEFETDGGAPFALHAIPAHIAANIDVPSPPVPREQGSCKLTFATEDLQAERARLERLGVMILDRPWGDWDAVDPEGNVFGVRSRD